MPHRFAALPFSASRLSVEGTGERVAKASVSNGAVTNELDLESGALTAGVIPSGRAARASFRLVGPPTLSGLSWRVSESHAGPHTVFTDDAGRSHAFAGSLVRAVRSDALLLATLEMPGHRYDLLAVDLRSSEGTSWAALRLPSAFRTVLAVDDASGIGAAVTERDGATGLLHVVRVHESAPRAVSLSMPQTFEAIDAACMGRDLAIVAGAALFVLDVDALPFDVAHRSLALRYEPIVQRGSAIEGHAVVVYAFATTFGVQHPTLGRLTIQREPTDPPVAVGQSIQLDDVREPLPRVLKVHRWSVAGGASVRPAADALELPSPEVSPLSEAIPASGPGHRVADLRRWAEAWGFTPPAALVRLLEATDEDPVLVRWLDQLGLAELDVRELSTDWAADPCLLVFATEANGDGYGLYLYPPSLARDEPPPIVRFWHETNDVEWLADGIEAFLAAWLSERAGDSEVGSLLRDRLRAAGLVLSAEIATEAEPPAFVPPMGTDDMPALDALRALEQRGELLAAERGYVRWYTQRDALRDARAGAPSDGYEGLARLYRKLGWHAALEVLERSAEDV